VLKEIGQILEHQTTRVDPALDLKMESIAEDDKPKRARIVPVKKAAIQKQNYSF
jgi:transcription termination factor Rho